MSALLPAARLLAKARDQLASRTDPFTIQQAADALGVDELTLFNWRDKGLLDWTAKPANRYRKPSPCISPADLRRLLGMTEAAP